MGGQPGFRRAGPLERYQGVRPKSSGRCGSSQRPLTVRRSATLHEGEQAAADVVPDPACQHQRARSVCLPLGCFGAAANAAVQSGRGAFAASLEAAAAAP